MDSQLALLLVAIVLGAVLAMVVRLILPGEQKIGVVFTIVIGTVGVLVGHFIAEALNIGPEDGFNGWKLAIQMGIVALLIGAIGGVGNRR